MGTCGGVTFSHTPAAATVARANGLTGPASGFVTTPAPRVVAAMPPDPPDPPRPEEPLPAPPGDPAALFPPEPLVVVVPPTDVPSPTEPPEPGEMPPPAPVAADSSGGSLETGSPEPQPEPIRSNVRPSET